MRKFRERVAGELEQLKGLAAEHPLSLTIPVLEPKDDGFHVEFHWAGLPGFQPIASDGSEGFSINWTQTFRIVYPPFYPAVPFRPYSLLPIWHPNIDLDSGFMCIWSSNNPLATILDALDSIQQMLWFDIFNTEIDHCMNISSVPLISQFRLLLADYPRSILPIQGLRQRAPLKSFARIVDSEF